MPSTAYPGTTAYGTSPNVPTVGDAIEASGKYSPYHQMPELATLTALGKYGTADGLGDTIPTPQVTTIPSITTLNPGTPETLPLSVVGYLWELDGVTIENGPSGGNTLTPGEAFSNANLEFNITDGTNTVELYYWPTLYSMANVNMYGNYIPTGPVNMIGFMQVYTSGTGASATYTPEFIPISMTGLVPAPSPEPGTFVLLGAGLAASAVLYLRRKVNG